MREVRRRWLLLGLAVIIALPVLAAQQIRVGGVSQAITQRAGLEGRIMWMDAGANMNRLNNFQAVDDVLEKCRQANINTVVVDVKPLSGFGLYQSKIVPRVKVWKGQEYPANFDILTTTMIHGRRRDMKVYAAINVFCEGHKLVKMGPLYEGAKYQSIVYDVERTVVSASGEQHALAVGLNQGPRRDEIVAYDSTYRLSVRLRPTDAVAVIIYDLVVAVADGSLADAGVSVPKDGHLLIGRGAGADWVLTYLQVGDQIGYLAKNLFQPILEAPSERVSMFVNPAIPEVRQRALDIVEELASEYAIDGIVFDRMRFASLRTDFSEFSRREFEKWLGQELERFPEDVLTWPANPSDPLIEGKYYREWLFWRAKLIRDWLAEARTVATKARRGIKLGVYVGSWYDTYYGVGVNWGASDYHPEYPWMTKNYNEAGYADLLDWVSTGCYYPIAKRETARILDEPEERTVEAAADVSMQAVNDVSFVYAGIYVLDYKDRPEEFRQALQAARDNSQGVMLFDLVYVEEYDWWHLIRESFPEPKRAPHDILGLRAAVVQAKRALAAAR